MKRFSLRHKDATKFNNFAPRGMTKFHASTVVAGMITNTVGALFVRLEWLVFLPQIYFPRGVFRRISRSVTGPSRYLNLNDDSVEVQQV